MKWTEKSRHKDRKRAIDSLVSISILRFTVFDFNLLLFEKNNLPPINVRFSRLEQISVLNKNNINNDDCIRRVLTRFFFLHTKSFEFFF